MGGIRPKPFLITMASVWSVARKAWSRHCRKPFQPFRYIKRAFLSAFQYVVITLPFNPYLGGHAVKPPGAIISGARCISATALPIRPFPSSSGRKRFAIVLGGIQHHFYNIIYMPVGRYILRIFSLLYAKHAKNIHPILRITTKPYSPPSLPQATSHQ